MRANIIGVLLLATAPVSAFEKDSVVGAWAIDAAHSGKAADGNTAGVMADVQFKADGTFTALYGTQGTWKLQQGKLLVRYVNSFRGDEEAPADGEFLKMPAPAMKGKFCYLKKK